MLCDALAAAFEPPAAGADPSGGASAPLRWRVDGSSWGEPARESQLELASTRAVPAPGAGHGQLLPLVLAPLTMSNHF